MRITVIRRFYLDDRKVVKVGDTVEIADKLARGFIAAGKAIPADDAPPPAPAKKQAGSNAMTTKSASGLVSGANKE